MFYPFSIRINKCSGNCNNIDDPYSKTRVPDVIKNLSLKVFNLLSRTNETRSIKWHEKCKCIKLFVIINKNRIKINVDVNVKN